MILFFENPIKEKSKKFNPRTTIKDVITSNPMIPEVIVLYYMDGKLYVALLYKVPTKR